MANILAQNVVVEFPIYQARARSLKNSLIRTATGGVFSQRGDDSVVVRSLDDVSFSLRDGDRLGIMGHNGSGKTTLLRVLSGVYPPVRGTIDVEGKVASMVNISLGLDGEATGYENIYLRGTLMGYKRRQIKDIVEDVCEFAGLGDFIDMPMRTYSSGMVMRLAFAISTRITADIILMDEWLSVGDAEFAEKAEQRMQNVVKNSGILVIASHNRDMLHKICNKVMELEHGRVVGQHSGSLA